MANYQKAGYQDSLQFDPSSGIIKYGNYEFWADQVGVKPQTQTFDFNTYKTSFTGGAGMAGAANPFNRMDDAALRAQFAKDVQAGNLRTAMPASTNPGDIRAASKLYGEQPVYERTASNGANAWSNLQNMQPQQAKGAEFRNIQQVDPNTYSVTSYDIPNDIRFLNSLNEKAQQLATASEQGQVTDSSRPNPKNARLGKPNYSRAATVLAGEATPLGGAATVLGA